MGKGGSFEREISKDLTEWLTGKKIPYMYWRCPASGALATIHEANYQNLSGDIRPLHPDAEFLTNYFSIECKTGYPKTSLWQHFKHLKGFAIKNFWQQCVYDALHADKHPMLIYRKKGRQIIIGLSDVDVSKLEDKSDMLKTLPLISMRFDLQELPNITFYDFKEFLEAVKPNDIRKEM